MTEPRAERWSMTAGTPWPVTFFAAGKPEPQGSKSHDRHGNMFESAAGLADWRRTVWAHAKHAMRRTPPIPKGVAVYAELRFVVYRPKGLPTTRPTPPATKKPDADKLARAAFDAMTGVIYDDDAQVVIYLATKRIAEPGEHLGVHVLIRPATRQDLQ